MAERLGIVLYWAGCILAGLWVLFALFIWSNAFTYFGSLDATSLAGVFLPALLLWLAGKGLRFIFAGK